MAIHTLYGAPHKNFHHYSWDKTQSQIWQQLKTSDKNGDVISASSKSAAGTNHFMTNKIGICYGHAYTVLGVKELTDAKGKKIKLVKMRNPWGTEKFKGDYSDSSTKWTPALKKQAGMTVKNDGEFFMTLKDFYASFELTEINFNVDKMSRAHFLVLNDTNKNTRTTMKCKGKCSYHKFTIKSATTQKVHLSAKTWHDRAYPEKCRTQASTRNGGTPRYHYYWLTGGDLGDNENHVDYYEWTHGETSPRTVTLKKGVTYTLSVELNW